MRLAIICISLAIGLAIPSAGNAQVPKDIEEGLRKIGQIVDPGCTARLYRPLMPKNDFNTYWPFGAASPLSSAQLYPGVRIARDRSFGPHPKDVLDIFAPQNTGSNRTVFVFVPGGGGNKIEQQVREGNAFYDNIGRWAVKNGMVGVTVQRHPASAWDDGGRDLSVAVDWVRANIARYGGNPNRIFIAAHSAGTGPLGVYVGHPERWKSGIGVKGAIFMSGNPVPSLGAAAGGGRGAGAPSWPSARRRV
jgi:triacylglycerol lipase